MCAGPWDVTHAISSRFVLLAASVRNASVQNDHSSRQELAINPALTDIYNYSDKRFVPWSTNSVGTLESYLVALISG